MLRVLVFITLCFLACSSAIAQDAKYLDLTFSVSRAGKVVATPSATVEIGKPAQFVIQDEAAKTGLRLDYTATTAITEAGLATAVVSMTVFERVNDSWQLVAEPRIQTLLDGSPGSVSLSDGKSKSVAVEVTSRIVSGETLKSRLNGKIPEANACSAESKSLNVLREPPRNCCSRTCAGSSQTMTCCGAVSCCACGVCCTPA